MKNRQSKRILSVVMLFVLLLSIAVPSMASTVLEKGDSGEEVLKVQQALVKYGYECNTNSKFNSTTVKAVKQYQKDWKLKVDGKVGDATRIGLLGGNFKLGDAGPKVKEFQKLLKEAGFSVYVDGFYGAKTVSAVKSFQTAAGLKANGVANWATRKALSDGKATYPTLKLGSKGTAVRKLQDALKTKGYFTGTINGTFNTATQKAVKAFQKAKGITVDGVAGYVTQVLLYEGYVPIDDPGEGKVGNSAYSLYYGCRGKRVYYLQKSLKSLGYYKGTIDSSYGELTMQAVKSYQTKKGLAADGIAGKDTIASLNKNSKVKIPTTFILDIGIRGDEVYEFTSFLVEKGYLSSTSRIYNSTVKNAAKTWQIETGKSITDGTITEALYNRIIAGKED